MAIGKFSKLLILILLTTFKGHAQLKYFKQGVVDSLEKILPNAVADTNKVNNLISLAQMYFDKKELDRSLTYARMADTIS